MQKNAYILAHFYDYTPFFYSRRIMVAGNLPEEIKLGSIADHKG